MPLVSIPQHLQQEESFFRFRFADSKSKKVRLGTIIDMKDCLVSSYNIKERRYKDYSYDAFKAKYANRHKTSGYKSAISHCFICGKQADIILLYKYTGCMIKEKYCSSCADKRIIKL
jgi:hypothetical protein